MDYYQRIDTLKFKEKELDLRVSKLESENKMRQNTIACVNRAYVTACEELHKRLSDLEEHKNHQIYENRKMSLRVDELDEKFTDYYESMRADIRLHGGVIKPRQELEIEYEKLINRIERLESSKLSQELDPKVWVFVKERLDKLESSILETRIQFIDQLGKDTKPHVCPVCQGLTLLSRKFIDTACNEKTDLPPALCLACEGKGVLWK